MTGLTVSDIAALTGGALRGPGGAVPSNAVIDSREVAPGSLFAALPGARADGHDFIPMAFEKGAACCLALRVPEGVTAR
jgi:UDP-N-acetylmuramoyl-tripeptide--D-alanyl-D-alanine ligase